MFDKDKFLKGMDGVLYGSSTDCTKKDIIRKFIALLKECVGTDAIGLRLKEGDDFPYYTTIGFTESFIMAESSLCPRGQDGRIEYGPDGMACLDCMCGNVIRGRVDPSLPFFTKGGSFLSNGTTKLLSATTEEQRQARTRNRCNAEGYESVCLVPVRNGDSIIGLLQMNDRDEGAFDEDDVRVIEQACVLFGEVLAPLIDAEDAVEDDVRRMMVRLEKFIGGLKQKIADM